MAVRKQSVSFTEAAFAYASERVESGEYPNVGAAVPGEPVRAKAGRDRERALFEAELQRRLALPLDRREPVGEGGIAAEAHAYPDALEKDQARRRRE